MVAQAQNAEDVNATFWRHRGFYLMELVKIS